MKTLLNTIIIALIVLVMIQLEIETNLPSKDSNILHAVVIIPFLILAVYGRIHIKEVEKLIKEVEND